MSRDDPSFEAEPLITWLREALTTTPYGEVGVLFYLREGRVVTAKRVHNETYKLPLEECMKDGLDDPGGSGVK